MTSFEPLAWCFVGVIWMISALFDYTFFTYYAQLKEYRFDRFQDFISTKAGKTFLFDFRMIWRTVIVATLYTFVGDMLTTATFLLIIIVIDLIPKIHQIKKRRIKRPKFTYKALLIILLALTFEFVIYYGVSLTNIILLVFVFRFFVAVFTVLLINIPTFFIKKLYIHLATAKMNKLSELKVVGITGSYGKSSTKEFLYHILSNTFDVVKTPNNINTEIGIAKFILKTKFTNKKIFIVEMGAYKRGEIQAICSMTNPIIGILTAIAPQHLSLFGSIKNICKSKHELLRFLPKNGLAITNSDNPYCRKHMHEFIAPVQTFGTESEYSPTLLIEDVKNTKNGIEATSNLLGEKRTIEASVVGAHTILNIAPVYLAANFLGIPMNDIDGRLKTLPIGQGSIKKRTYGNAIILDDSANCNPEGFKAALDVLNTYPSDKRRIVVTRGMLELGDQSDELHEQIGGEISFVVDELVIITPDFVEPLERGVVRKYNTNVKKIFEPMALVEYFQSLKNENVVVLLENRMPSSIKKEFNFPTS
jgi:UDP-N-acetylmuramoyl-tripeptide--D-alanyl-D-alanine ligase